MKKTLIGLCLGLASTMIQAAPTLELNTSQGKIVVELDDKNAPISTKNFLDYAKSGFYNGTIFHRVIANFMIQGGGFEPSMRQKPTGPAIQNEAKNGLKNQRGTLAMARTSDPHSATAQFFINHKDNNSLNYPSQDGWGYAVFGKVTQGMDVVDKIAATPTGKMGPFSDVPRPPITIDSVKILSEK